MPLLYGSPLVCVCISAEHCQLALHVLCVASPQRIDIEGDFAPDIDRHFGRASGIALAMSDGGDEVTLVHAEISQPGCGRFRAAYSCPQEQEEVQAWQDRRNQAQATRSGD